MSIDTRVWLLPNGEVALKRNSDWMQVTQWGSFWDNANESHATHIVFLDELPEGSLLDITKEYRDYWAEDLTLLVDCDLPPAVTE